MSAIENAISYWSQPDIENAKRVIAAHAAWGEEAAKDLPLFLTPKVLEILKPSQFDAKCALEIGCGIGRLMLPMASVFGLVAGVDVCPKMISLAKEYLSKYPKNEGAFFPLICDGSGRLPVFDHFYDFVYSTIVFQHLPDLETVRLYLKETFRVLVPGGVARIQTFRGPNPFQWDAHWGWFFESMDSFAAEFEAVGFEVVERHQDTLFALAERREPIEQDWLWITARKP